ncbi:MAG: protein kinase [Sandaracinaceae bacterium]|nr:protein kinase [Sandaracinaceae bacterium]
MSLPTQPASEHLGPFRVGEILGSGGFGTVYRAIDTRTSQPVALKVLAPHIGSQETLSRFEREGNIRIDHPNVVRVIDAGQDRGLSYIAFELLEGAPLTDLLKEAPLPPAVVVDMGIQICAGLTAAHSRGVIHRDLKPGNVFVQREGPIKILDFGIARPMGQAGPQLTMAGSVIGTPGYLSPEQAKGDAHIAPAADLWALGVILYQALAGPNPFLRSTAVATILAVVLEDPPPLTTPDLPPGLAEIVLRCLHKDPHARWESAAALSQALQSLDLAATQAVGQAQPTLPADEQRLVALLFATDVHDAPALDRAVHEWGGELIPMLGGAIGVFGGRTYEGDESARAVHAALAARDAVGYVAVAAGRASGAGGAVSGDAVRAVELACQARLNGVAVDPVAARGLAGLFPLREARGGLFEVPREAGQLDSTGSFLAVRDDVPLLGRETELSQIDQALEQALGESRATVIWASGAAGIGKSRLRMELERRLRRRSVPMLAGRGESHRRDAAFHVMATALRSEPTLEPFFLNAAVPADRRRAALRELCERVLGDPIWARQCVEPLGRLLGLPDAVEAHTGSRRSDPQLMADRVRVSLMDVLSSFVSVGPLALLIEDAQWADDASLALLDDLVGRTGDRPLLVFVAARPELAERNGELFASRELVRISPRGLRTAEVATLAGAIAGRDLRPALVEEVSTRTGGNPFFVEQIVRELVEQDLLDREHESLPIPLDVEGAVQSRLDHLPAPEKQLCKKAAVYASGFTEPALEALDQKDGERLLASLARRGLVSARGSGATAQDREYRFRNALVAEVAYRMNGEEARRELHLMAARYLSSLATGEREELARHFELGGETERAAQAYAEATARAARRGDTESVLRCSARALELGLRGPDAFDVQMARADALSFLGRRDEQRSAIEAALTSAATPAHRARALAEKANLLASVSEHDEGMRVAEQAVAVAREAGDADTLAAALARRGWLLLYAGRIPEAAEAIGEAARGMDRLAPETAALIAAWRAQLSAAMGDLGKRKLAYEDSARRYRAIGDLRRQATTEVNLADTFNRVGAYEQAEAALREALASCRRVGNRVVEGYALANLGYALAMQERLDEALPTFEAALAVARETGRPRLAIAVHVYRARSLMAGHRPPGEVLSEAETAAREAQEGELPALCAGALSVATQALLALGDAPRALETAQRAMQIRDEIGTMEEDEAEVFLALADALMANGRVEEAREIIARGASRLEFLAGRIEDTDWRARFLVEVPTNRRLIELDSH